MRNSSLRGLAFVFGLYLTGAAVSAQQPAPAKADAKPGAGGTIEANKPSPLESEILAATEQLVAAFNDGKVEQLLNSFLADGELIDEEGNIHQGHAELTELAKAFFAKYPGAKTQASLESVRQIGDLVLADGSRLISTLDGKSSSALRFTSVWKKTDKGYQLASMRDFNEEVPLTPREGLEPLAWMVGKWVNEGSDAKVELNFRWADDQNFILGDILVMRGAEVVAKSSQRIAWDATRGSLRSWTFDSDGGFGESQWTPTEEGWVLQSAATTPDGATGSAIMKIVPSDEHRFQILGSHRLVGNVVEPDFEYTVVRQPPSAGKQ